jgi:hypothetical protein
VTSREDESLQWRLYSRVTILTLVMFGALTSTHGDALAANEPTPWQGVYERINIAAYLLWMAVLAVALLHTRDQQKVTVPDTVHRVQTATTREEKR